MPSPVGGWDAVSPLADMDEDRAIVLDNWFPSTGDVRVRRGHHVHCDEMGSAAVESLMVYHGTTVASSAMFCSTGGDFFDVSASGAGVATSVTGQTNDRWQSINFTTSGGKFLWACNGADDPIHYNGSVWANPSLTTTTFAAGDIIHVNGHKNRIWVVFRDSTVAGYLPTGAIAGTVTNFELGGLFTRGGYLVAMATWTRDGGSGEDDLAVFISSRGQCAVYAGTDPSSANTWALIGVFDLGPPIGRRCFTKVAGDLALVNIDGVLPLSKALEVDRGAASTIAITSRINNAMNEAARLHAANFGWELLPYSAGTYVLLNVPIAENDQQHQYVMNTLTGAWCRFTGQNMNCWAVFKDQLFAGGNDGKVYRADFSGADVDMAIDAVGKTAYSYYKSPGVNKQWSMIQPLLTADSNVLPALGLSTDFKDNATLGTPSASTVDAALYDSAIWDVDVYALENRAVADWSTVSGIGQCASVHFRALSNSASGDVVLRMNGFNLVYQPGNIGP
jgi:hypothetical protein